MKLKNKFTAFYLRLLLFNAASDEENVDDCENYDFPSTSSCFIHQFYVLLGNDAKHLGRSLSFIAAKVHHFP